jgi:putative membrane protein
MRKIVVSFHILFVASAAHAHAPGQPVDGASWTFDPWIVAPLVVFGGMYAIGAITLSRRRGWNGTTHNWRDLAWLVGWLSLAAALISPLHWLGERLLAFHMIEHEIIMTVSVPLIVVARPVGTWLWSLPRRVRLGVASFMQHPNTRGAWNWLSAGRNATLLHGVAIWAWHAPALFDAAVENLVLHCLQHLSFFATAVLFWWSVFRRSETGAAACHVFVTMLHTSVLGALMALAPRVLYQQQTSAAASWGLTPLEDQQLAGIIMWVPAGTIYAGAALALLAIWIKGASKTTGQKHVAAAP